jgi:hypothetical protein
LKIKFKKLQLAVELKDEAWVPSPASELNRLKMFSRSSAGGYYTHPKSSNSLNSAKLDILLFFFNYLLS